MHMPQEFTPELDTSLGKKKNEMGKHGTFCGEPYFFFRDGRKKKRE
jgi:hypothetical protein